VFLLIWKRELDRSVSVKMLKADDHDKKSSDDFCENAYGRNGHGHISNISWHIKFPQIIQNYP
jgi:hypothetical protein